MERKKRPRWAVGVVGVFAFFVLCVLAMAYLSASQNIDLVSDQYYDDGVCYQDRIQARQRAANMKEAVTISVDQDRLLVQFPKASLREENIGRVILYRPADRQRDFEVPLSLGSGANQAISIASLEKGLWRVQIHWRVQDLEYYMEQPIVLQ